MKQEDMRKGVFFHTDTTNSQCDEFGALEITSVKVEKTKFNTNWYGSVVRPSDYIDRNTIIIKGKNRDGKKVELRYWEDEFYDYFHNEGCVVTMKATNRADADAEFEKWLASTLLEKSLMELKFTIKDEYHTIFKSANVLGDERTERISELVGELVQLL
jgi:hypothetical protein